MKDVWFDSTAANWIIHVTFSVIKIALSMSHRKHLVAVSYFVYMCVSCVILPTWVSFKHVKVEFASILWRKHIQSRKVPSQPNLVVLPDPWLQFQHNFDFSLNWFLSPSNDRRVCYLLACVYEMHSFISKLRLKFIICRVSFKIKVSTNKNCLSFDLFLIFSVFVFTQF